MEVALDEVLNQGKIAEATICYTGDILDASREKYNLDYYIRMARELEKRGAHIIGIKDMSGLLKPNAAYRLIRALKDEIALPIHLHTHDTSGNGVATCLMAAQAGVDIIDAAISSMSGLTSQPSLNSIIAALERSERDTGIDLDGLQVIADYWSDVRPVYKNFESDLQAASAEIYKYEIPGGQYTNLKPQVESFGLGHKFQEVKDMYKSVNTMLGDIVKVTPSSKAVGDMAIFMVQNDLTPEMMGQPEGGFPADLQKVVLKDRKPITCRPGELLDPEDFEYISNGLYEHFGLEPDMHHIISYAMYPKVYTDYMTALSKDGRFSMMGSDVFFHGLREGETSEVMLEEGRILVIRLVEIHEPDKEGYRDVDFEVDGNRRSVRIKDDAAAAVVSGASQRIADENNDMEVGANIPGNIVKVLVRVGEVVEEGQPIAVIEAMKMETNIIAKAAGEIEEIFVKAGDQVKAGQLIATLK